MFDIGWGELIVIAVVALVVIGPKELPTVLRTIGEWMTKIRRMASEFQGQFQDAMREAELADLKKQVDSMTDFTATNPLESARRDIESAFDDKPATPAVAGEPSAAVTEPPPSVVTEAPPSAFADGAVTAPPSPVAPAADVHVPAPEPTPAPADASAHAAAPVTPEVGGGRAA